MALTPVPERLMLTCIGTIKSSVAIVPSVEMLTPLVSCSTTDVPALTIAKASRPSVFVKAETEVKTSRLVAVTERVFPFKFVMPEPLPEMTPSAVSEPCTSPDP